MEIIKAKNDYRNYKYFTLENGIEVLLILDNKASTSSVSLSVGCGSFEDNVPGIAHFLEHMLFMGNEKYPDEKYYSSFIGTHGGYSNAYTAGDHTNYYYTIDPNYILKSFDIFSNFFICPLFDQSCLSREMNAVDSEHKKNILNDNWRNFQMIRNICNNQSPLSKFSTGNLETLNLPNIREIVIDFFNKYYSSNIMKMSVLYNGEQSEDIIIEGIKNHFNNIKNKNVSINRELKINHLLSEKNIKIVPIKDNDYLILLFELSYNSNIKNNNIINYISYLINHQGDNTLYNYLNKNGHIEDMYSSEECSIDNCLIFSIKFKLTKTANTNLIINAYQRYINILIESSFNNKIVDLLEEDRFLNNQEFDNFEIEEEGDFVTNITSNMINFNTNRNYILKYNYLIGEFLDKNILIKEIQSLLSELSIINNKNMSILNISKSHNSEQFIEEKFYKIKYQIDNLNLQINNNFNGILNFPEKNQYIIKEKEILNLPSDILPIKLEVNNEYVDLYIKKTFDLNTTDSLLYINIKKDDIYSSVDNFVKYKFLIELFYLLFNSTIYNINKANYNFYIILNKSNYTFKLSGYYKYLDNILEIILNKLKELINNDNIDNLYFKIIKEKLLKQYSNKKLNAPYQQITSYEEEILLNKYFNSELIETTINNINSFNEILSINPFSYNKITIYCEGNIYENKLMEIYNIINKNYNYYQSINNFEINLDTNKTSQILEKEYNNFNKEEENECVEMNFFINNMYNSNNWINEYCALLIFDLIISKEFFDKLRTKEQLGYITRSNYSSFGFGKNKYTIYKYLVQSNIKNTEYLKNRIINFIKDDIYSLIDNTSDDEYLEIITSIKEKLNKPFNNLEDSAGFHYDKIINKNFIYNFNKIIMANIDTIDKTYLFDFYKRHFSFDKYLIIKIKN